MEEESVGTTLFEEMIPNEDRLHTNSMNPNEDEEERKDRSHSNSLSPNEEEEGRKENDKSHINSMNPNEEEEKNQNSHNILNTFEEIGNFCESEESKSDENLIPFNPKPNFETDSTKVLITFKKLNENDISDINGQNITTCESSNEDLINKINNPELLSAYDNSNQFNQSEEDYNIEEINYYDPMEEIENFIFTRILSMLDFKSLLKSRLVNSNWNDLIENSKLIWKKGGQLRLYDQNVINWKISASSSYLLETCPNFRIVESDLRAPRANSFLLNRGRTLKEIAIIRSKLTLATFQTLLMECPNIEKLSIEITEDLSQPQCLFYRNQFESEEFSSKLYLTRLKILKLKAPQNEEHIDLGPKFIRELIHNSLKLKELYIHGFSDEVCSNFISKHIHAIFAINQQHSFLEKIEFYKIPYLINQAHFYILFEHRKIFPFLKKLAICGKEISGEVPSFNGIIQAILLQNSTNLINLELSNCPIDEQAFIAEMPKLNSLKVRGTLISNFEFLKHFPKLKILDHETFESQDLGIERVISHNIARDASMSSRISQIIFGQTIYFYYCTKFDFVCLAGYLSMLSISLIWMLNSSLFTTQDFPILLTSFITMGIIFTHFFQ